MNNSNDAINHCQHYPPKIKILVSSMHSLVGGVSEKQSGKTG